MTLSSVQQLERPKSLISSKLEWATKKVRNKDLDGWDLADVIFEEDVTISSNGPFPEIFFSDRIHEILDQREAHFENKITKAPCHYYTKKLLRVIAGVLSRVVKLDYNYKKWRRGKFARFAIDLDFNKPLQAL
ncbi:hypothetical protein Goklo_027665 [Gossypium klotzschianum]|uniref:Uncharacterized protein n=1 Tax=Gossypium klotzschianum TaxID=34286 RepID=A0A7J8TYP8_9ROSI|nr:hypothetical protein [Gossypium klotzschianum]